MDIQYVKVNNLKESILTSKLPTSKNLILNPNDHMVTDNDIKRAKKLAKVKAGTGHDCFLKGINVFMIITAPEYFWKQFERYSFQDTVSSTSTMHKILEVELDDVLPDNIYPDTIRRLQEDIESYNYWANKNKTHAKRIWKRIIANLPMGFQYTRAITTNYLQLKTMYFQRKNHKLDEWKHFCLFIEALRMFKELILDDE